MAVDAATFLKSFPEFLDCDKTLLGQKLSYAIQMVPAAVWGDFAEQGTFLYCARFLALSPYGRKLGLATESGQTNYDIDLERLKLSITVGGRAL